MPNPYSLPSRRDFLKLSSACMAHMALMASPFPAAARARWSHRAQGRIVARESFGRLESVGEGLWAFVSTPLEGDYTTVSNGGIITGEDGVLVIEGFQTPEGARWMAEKARELSGSWPSHVLVTHYHGDHTGGVEGYFPEPEASQGPGNSLEGPVILATPTTRSLRERGFTDETAESTRHLWADAVMLGEDRPENIDLGGRVVELAPRQGHTASDVTVELREEGLTWCGDLVWNGMFPNYMDAVPSRLSRAVRALQGEGRNIYVPGHGPLADTEDIQRYVAVIDGLEETARMAWEEGWTAQEAGERHRIPPSLGDWTLFNPSYFQRAVEAWMKEWQSGKSGRP